MKLSQFQFALDADKIAKNPPRWRDECKLMVLHKDSGEIEISFKADFGGRHSENRMQRFFAELSSDPHTDSVKSERSRV